MRRQFSALRTGVALVFVAAVAVPPLAAQSRAAQPKPRATGKEWTPPRTPWGDPDISGDFSNKYEIGTAFERPKEFEGRRIEDFTSQ